MCAEKQSAPPPPSTPAVVAVGPSPNDAASAPSTPDGDASVATVEPPPAPPAPVYSGALPKDCKAIAAAIEKETKRTCQRDDECGNFNVNCACPQAIAKSALPKLNALQAKERELDCYSKGPPRPCATCAPPPVRHCVSGSCR
jgi:hypothetical protein